MSGENRARLFTGPGRPQPLKTVPAQNYIKIDGRGDPNGADFSNRVGALYVVAYAVKAAYKAASLQQEIDDFAVCPLEGVWAQIRGDDLEKDKLEYTLTIRQPGFYQRGAGTAGTGTGAAQKAKSSVGRNHLWCDAGRAVRRNPPHRFL